MIKGYKAFYKGLVNQFGEKYELNLTYKTNSTYMLEKASIFALI